MNIIKKVLFAALLALSALGLISPLAFADGKTDAEATCPGCHGVIINGIQAVGSGGRACAQRTTAEWTTTIERMNAKGCAVPAGSIVGIANYLAGLLPLPLICYNGDGTSFTISASSCPNGTSTTQPPNCNAGLPTFNGTSWVCFATLAPTTTSSTTSTTIPTVTTTTTTTLFIGTTCYYASGVSFVVYNGTITPYCPFGTAYTPPPSCPGGTLSIVIDHVWQCNIQCPDGTTVTAQWGAVPTCPSTSSTTSTTTTSSTTTTTLCNAYVNGTTQYPYSGSGACHSFANDDVTGLHIERDQAYCKKHMSHFNSKGNHVHAYPHPMCM